MTDSAPSDQSVDAGEQRTAVRERYGNIATKATSGCCDTSGGGSGDCGGTDAEYTQKLGYTEENLDVAEAAADLSLGCGNPTAIASLSTGDTVLDLGSGGGFDCFLAAREVGADGRVIGVDMTPSMVERARETASENDASNVEFRLGEIEHLPVADAIVDVIISNCVVNLSPDKPRVFEEAFRVLTPGGRLAISDVVQTADIPVELTADLDSISQCVAGAATIAELEAMLGAAGFEAIDITPKSESEEFIRRWDDQRDPSEYVTSAIIEARKPPSDIDEPSNDSHTSSNQ